MRCKMCARSKPALNMVKFDYYDMKETIPHISRELARKYDGEWLCVECAYDFQSPERTGAARAVAKGMRGLNGGKK